jgi:hypothetical protein
LNLDPDGAVCQRYDTECAYLKDADRLAQQFAASRPHVGEAPVAEKCTILKRFADYVTTIFSNQIANYSSIRRPIICIVLSPWLLSDKLKKDTSMLQEDSSGNHLPRCEIQVASGLK